MIKKIGLVFTSILVSSSSFAGITHPTCAIDPEQIKLTEGDFTLSNEQLYPILSSKGYQVKPGHAESGSGLKFFLHLHEEKQRTGFLVFKKDEYSITAKQEIENLDSKEKIFATSLATEKNEEAALKTILGQIESQIPECKVSQLTECTVTAGVAVEGYTWTKNISSCSSKEEWFETQFKGKIELKKEFHYHVGLASNAFRITYGIFDFMKFKPTVTALASTGAKADIDYLVRALKAHLDGQSEMRIDFAMRPVTNSKLKYDMIYNGRSLESDSAQFVDSDSRVEEICISPENAEGCVGVMKVHPIFNLKCE